MKCNRNLVKIWIEVQTLNKPGLAEVQKDFSELTSRGPTPRPGTLTADRWWSRVNRKLATTRNYSKAKVTQAMGTFKPLKSLSVDTSESPRNHLRISAKNCKKKHSLEINIKAWRRARVVFISKTGKKDLFHPKSFRPISLIFVLKMEENIIDNSIRTNILMCNSPSISITWQDGQPKLPCTCWRM